MRIRNTETNFGYPAQFLHWVTAGLIVYQFVLAQMAEEASLFQQLGIFARHKSVGMTILVLAIARLGWRIANPRPMSPVNQPRYQQLVARVSHRLMYALIFALPITGWVMSSSANTPVSYFGLFTWPDLVAPHETWVPSLQLIHGTLFKTLAAIVFLHAGAAFYHHLVAKDDVLRRMIPGWSRNGS